MGGRRKSTGGKEDGEAGLLPRLRFPEFRGAEDWAVKSFGRLFAIGNGRDYRHLKTGDVPVYGSGGYMLSVSEYLYEGESVCIGRKGTINNPMFLSGRFWTVDTLFYTHSFKDCLPKFIFSVFQQVDWLKHNEAGGVPSLSKTNIEKIKFAIPAPAEQQKIANCLTSVDELIAAQAQKVDALKTHKKGLMQQLFPREGETQPRLRFPEFKTLWKAGVLDQIASTVMGNAFRSTDFIESGTQVIRIGNLYQGELQLDRSPIYMSDSQASENSKFTVNAFDILMSMTGTMGKRDYGFVVQVPADCKQLLLNQRVMKIVPKRNCDAGFLLQLLKNESLLEQLYSIPGGTKQANLSAQDVKELNICYPQIPEQQRISSCLRTLDTLITTEAQKLETLKLHKRGLMQQLFPSPEVIPA